MTILVTGGLGYIGAHTVVALMKVGHEAVIVDDLSNSHPEVISRIKAITGKAPVFEYGDIRNASFLDRVIEHYSCASAIHFAGLKSVRESQLRPIDYYDVNVVGLHTLIKVMNKRGLRKLIFSSTAALYGNAEVLPVAEDASIAPLTPYGQSKWMGEQMLRDTAAADPSWDITLLRYFNPVGAHESGLIGEVTPAFPANLMPYVCDVAFGQRPILRIFGNDYDTPDGTGVRDFIHVMDLAEGHLAAHDESTGAGVHTFNLGTGRGYSVLELVRAFETATGQRVPFEITHRRPGDLGESYADATHASAVLGWTAKRGLETMCQDHWAWRIKNPKGYGNMKEAAPPLVNAPAMESPGTPQTDDTVFSMEKTARPASHG